MLYYNCYLFKEEEEQYVHSRDHRRPLSGLCWHFLKYSSFFRSWLEDSTWILFQLLWRSMYYHISLVMNLSSCRNVVWTVWTVCLSRHELIVTSSVPVADKQPQEISFLNDWRQKLFSAHRINVFLVCC